MTLTVKTRPDVTWSDGEPFSAEDVAYTFNHLVEVGSAVKWGADVQQFLETAEATDENTVVFTFKVPAPRFFEFIAYKFDIGVYIMPKHIFEGQDLADLRPLRPRQGLAGHDRALAGRLRLARAEGARPGRLLVGRGRRRRQAAGAGALHLPARPGRAGSGRRHHLQPVRHRPPASSRPTFPTVFDGNDKVTTWTGHESPFGNVDWWPHSLYLNNEVAPWTTRTSAGRSATTSTASRSSTSAGSGASLPSTLFVPDYPRPAAVHRGGPAD